MYSQRNIYPLLKITKKKKKGEEHLTGQSVFPLENRGILHFKSAKPDVDVVSITSCLAPAQMRARNQLASTLPVAAERDPGDWKPPSS